MTQINSKIDSSYAPAAVGGSVALAGGLLAKNKISNTLVSVANTSKDVYVNSRQEENLNKLIGKVRSSDIPKYMEKIREKARIDWSSSHKILDFASKHSKGITKGIIAATAVAGAFVASK
ncbi:MAG: hypothetical protein LUG16_00280, partial [Candidatus Gastranaerophilales bacterium]|nr:hypothetical protein [Candidatus Gastranaerophilales bacterium]